MPERFNSCTSDSRRACKRCRRIVKIDHIRSPVCPRSFLTPEIRSKIASVFRRINPESRNTGFRHHGQDDTRAAFPDQNRLCAAVFRQALRASDHPRPDASRPQGTHQRLGIRHRPHQHITPGRSVCSHFHPSFQSGDCCVRRSIQCMRALRRLTVRGSLKLFLS